MLRGAGSRCLRHAAPAGSVVNITFDRQELDLYGRSLRYLWTTDGTFINAELIRRGDARVMTIPPNDRYAARFVAAEAAARHDHHLGLWAACAGPAPPKI